MIHVLGVLRLSSRIRLANNYPSATLKEATDRCQRKHDKCTEYAGIRDKLQKKLVPRKPHHPTDPRTKVVFPLEEKG